MAVSDYGIILKWVDWVFEKILRIKAQKDRDALESDPAGWFNSHFANRLHQDDNPNPSDNRGTDEPRD